MNKKLESKTMKNNIIALSVVTALFSLSSLANAGGGDEQDMLIDHSFSEEGLVTPPSSFFKKKNDEINPKLATQPEQLQLADVSHDKPLNVEPAKKKEKSVRLLVDPKLSATRSQDVSTLEHNVRMAKLNLQMQKITDELNEGERQQKLERKKLQDQSYQSEWDKEKQAIEARNQVAQDQLKLRIQQLEQQIKDKAESDDVLKNSIFVTKIVGLEGNLSARILFENNMVNKTSGEYLANGAKIVRIEVDGIWLEYKGDIQLIPITTSSYAYSKTINKNDESEDEEEASSVADSTFGAPSTFFKK